MANISHFTQTVNGISTTYDIHDAGAIPLSGSNAITGSISPATDISCDLGSPNCDFANVYAKNVKTRQIVDSLHLNYNNGAFIILRGKQQIGETGLFKIYAYDGTNEKYLVGKPDGYLAWNGSPISFSSDIRLKSDIESISDKILDAWENLEPKQYKYKSDVETDKDTAQTHYGWIAQDVEYLLKGDRKAEVQNGLFTHDYWDEQKEISHEETYTEEVETKSGEKQTVTKTRKVIDQPYIEKGDSYGLRYTECLVVECKYLRRCIARLTARIEELEKGNNIK